MDFYEEFEFVVGNDGYSIALRTPPRSEERSAKIHALWESRTRFVRRRLSNVSSAVTKSLIAPVRVNRVLHRAITPIIPIISTRNSMQGRIITLLLKVAHPALRIPLDYRLTGLIDHRSTRVESTRAKSCSKLTFQEIPPRSAYDPPRSCAGSLQRSSFISRPVMLPLFNSI